MRFIKVIVVFIVAFFTSSAKAVYVAHNAFENQFRYHAAIDVYRIQNEPIKTLTAWDCSGAIISSKYVITSYDCVCGYNFDGSWLGTTFRITVGCSNLKYTTCLSYNSTVKPRLTPEHLTPNLIALIQVPQQITINYAIQPVTLPAQNSKSRVSTSDSAITYVATGFRGQEAGGILRYVHMKTVPMSDCRPFHENIVHDSSLCLQGTEDVDEDIDQPESTLCFIEFGVPLVHTETLIGIFNYTILKCPIVGPSVFIRIEPFVDWIEEQKLL